MLALRQLMKSSGVVALAAGLAVVALPSAAMAEPGDHGRGGWQAQGGGNGGGGDQRRGDGNGGGWGQRQQSAPAPVQQQVQPRPQPQPAPQARNWGGGAQQGGSWQARAAQGGHDWNNGGGANRATPSWNGQAQARPPVQNGWQQRNPTYSDPNRTRDYGANRGDNRQANEGHSQTWQRNGNDWRSNDGRYNGARPEGWDGQRWNGQNWDRNAENRGNWQRDRNGGWNGNRDSWQRDRNGGWSGNRNTNWNRDWRRDNRYNWSGWRNDHRDVFRMGRYNPPYRDWNYRRLSIGFYLDSGFYGSNYLIDDPYDYRLPPAYGPYRWVRYYDDALLVNIYDGEVADVIYDFFW